jgi:hypothetical protein
MAPDPGHAVFIFAHQARMDGWLDAWVDGWMDGWMHGWMCGPTERRWNAVEGECLLPSQKK